MSGLTLEPFPRASGAALSSVSLFFVLVETGNLAHVRTHLINRDHVLRDFPLPVMDPETNDDVQACALLQNISSLKLLEKLPVAHALIDASPISQRISVPGNDKPTDSDALLSLFSPATASKNSRFQRGEADHRDAGSSAAIETANTSPAYSKTSSAVPTPIVPGLDEDRAPAPPTQDLAWSSTETPRSAPLEPYPSSESSGIKLAAVFTPKWANSAWQKLFSHSDFFSALTAPALKDLTSTLNSHSELAPSSPATVATIGEMPFSIFTQSLSTTDKHWVLLTAILSRSPASSPSNSEQSSQQHTDVHLHKRKRSRSPNQCETTLLASAPQTPIPSSTHDLLQTDPLYNILKESTMGRLTLEYPWHETSLGPISHWGPELRTLISQLHQSPFRSALWVGSDLTMLYNDCYIQAAGRKHPHGIFGKKGSVAWAEIWDQIGPAALTLFEGKASHALDQLFFMETSESSKLTETYYSWSWIPIFDSKGKFVAAVNDAFETTDRVLGDRRLGTLRDLALTTSRATCVEEYYQMALEALSRNSYDLPFALVWSAQIEHNPSKKHALGKDINVKLAPTTHSGVCNLQLKGTIGVPVDHPSGPSQVAVPISGSSSSSAADSSTVSASSRTLTLTNIESSEEMWPFKEALSQRKPVYISDLGSRNTGFEVRGWPEEAISAVLIPILTDSDADPQAVFVFGLNPRRPWSESEAQFFQLLSKSLSTGISSTKLYEDAAAKALSLQQLDHQKSTFYSNISHELRQPLQLILGPLEDVLTSGNATDPAVREPLKMVTRHAQRLLRLVNSLLDFSQLEAGRTQPRLRPADIGAVTKDLASLFRSAIERGKIEYIVDCPPSPSPVWVDLEIFEKIVFNVLGNAFKYTSQGQISVHIEYTKETFLLHISDTGSGIPEDSINHIFERFYRVEQNTSRTFEGTGIGLALTAELVKTMGGSISVQSQLGVGSTFTIKLPRGTKHVPKGQLVEQASDSDFGSMPNRLQYALSIIDEASLWYNSSSDSSSASTQSNPSSEAVDPATSAETRNAVVLICDDNLDMRQYAINVLSKHFTCYGFGNGEDVHRWLSKAHNHADLLVTDRMMPRMDGMTLLRNLRSEPSSALMPIIILSARASEEDRIEALEAGADEALGKPISSRELMVKVQNHVQLGRMRIELEKKVMDRTRALLDAEVRSRDLAEQLGTVLRMSPCGIFASTSDGVLNYVNQAWRRISGIEGLETFQNWTSAIHEDHRQEFSGLWSHAIDQQTGITQYEFRWAEDRHDEPAYSQIDMQPQLAPDGSVTFIGSLTDTSNIKKLERLHVQEVEQRANDAVRMKQMAELNVDLASHEIRNPLSALYQNGELVGESLERLFNQVVHISEDSKVDLKALSKELEDDIEAIESVVLCATHLRRITDDILGWSKMNVGLLTLSKSDFHVPSQGTAIVRMLEIEAAAKEVDLDITIASSIDHHNAAWVHADAHRMAQTMINFCTNAIRHTSESTGSVKKVQVIISATKDFPPKPEGSIRVHEHNINEKVQENVVWISCAVVDTGKGLSNDELNKLFQRFAQTNPERDSLAGYGLGLFVCKRIISLHDGFIEVSSNSGQGSSFRFVIPAPRAAPRPLTDEHTGLGSTFGRALRRRRPREGVPHSDGSTTKPQQEGGPGLLSSAPSTSPSHIVVTEKIACVLIIEDNLINQKVLKRQLSQRAYDTLVANNGQEALDLLTSDEGNSVSVALMDLEMPVMGGMDAVRALRAWEASQMQPRHLPVIAVTGNAREEQVQACLASGFDSVATKPYRISELVQQIQKLLEPARRS